MAFEARDRSDLLHALNEFLDDALVLPPGELDKKTLLPVLNMAKEKTRLRKRRRKEKEGEASSSGVTSPEWRERVRGGTVSFGSNIHVRSRYDI